MPLKNTKVVHPDWSEHHQPTAQGTMTGLCDLFNPDSGPAPYPLPEDYDPAGTPIATGIPCRVQALTSAQSAVYASQPTTSREYLVTVPLATVQVSAGEQGTIVKLTQADDPHLPGRTLRVIDVQHGTEIWERALIVSDNLTQNNPA